MKLIQVRFKYNPIATISNLLIEGKHFCYCLEDVVRPLGLKVYGKTAIAAGIYPVQNTFSQRFQKLMPLVMNVPNFSGIRMHGGNTAKDTDGCIIVAYNLIDDYTVQSSASGELTELLGTGFHTLEIIDTNH
jgi:hypothetical protein